jgi:hypothetical protein
MLGAAKHLFVPEKIRRGAEILHFVQDDTTTAFRTTRIVCSWLK